MFLDVPPPEALERFLLDLHIRLLMPGRLGLWVTGLAGFALLLLLTTGLYVHWPNRKRALEAPRRDGARKLLADLHTLLGVWSVPFTAALGFTGAFFSLAGSLLIPLFAFVALGGDIDAIEAAVRPRAHVEVAETVAPLAPVIEDAVARSGSAVERVEILRAAEGGGLQVTVHVADPGWAFSRRAFLYDGHRGTFLRETPGLGSAPSVGTFLLRLIGALHFGTLAGLTTKVVWFLLGLVTCALAGTGFALWAVREGRARPRFGERALGVVAAASAGLPLAVALSVLAWSTTVALGGPPRAAMTWAFCGGLLLSGMSGLRFTPALALRLVLLASALAYLTLPVAGWWAVGSASLAAPSAVAVDLGFLLAGVLLASAGLGFRGRRQADGASSAGTVAEGSLPT